MSTAYRVTYLFSHGSSKLFLWNNNIFVIVFFVFLFLNTENIWNTHQIEYIICIHNHKIKSCYCCYYNILAAICKYFVILNYLCGMEEEDSDISWALSYHLINSRVRRMMRMRERLPMTPPAMAAAKENTFLWCYYILSMCPLYPTFTCKTHFLLLRQ